MAAAETARALAEDAREAAEQAREAADALRDEKVDEVYAAFTAGALKGDKGDPGSYENHAHGNLTGGGAIGTAAGRLVETGAGGLLTAGRAIVAGSAAPEDAAAGLSAGDIYLYCPTLP